MNSIITKLSNTLKGYKKRKEIKDIVLFGSLLKGKEDPSDIDVLIILETEVDKDLEYEVRNNLKKVQNKISLNSTTTKELYEESFFARDAIFFEGFSLLEKQFLATKQGYVLWGLFKYKSANLDNTKKTTFYYALNGRNNSQGLIKKYGLIRFSNNSVLVPLNKISLMTDFFDEWTEYTYLPMLIPTRLSRKDLLER